MMQSKVFRGAAAVLAVVAWAGCAARTPFAPPPPLETSRDKAPYVLGASDVVSIRVWKNPDLSVVRAPVRLHA